MPAFGDAAVEPAEVGDDAIEGADDVAFDGDVRGVGFGAHAERAASVADGGEARCVEIDERQVGAARGESSSPSRRRGRGPRR